VAKIEATAFVSPKAVPNMRDAAEVMGAIKRSPDVIYSALAPNLRGAVDAVAAGAQEINVVVSASETHNKANVRLTCEESLEAIAEIVRTCSRTSTPVNVGIATTFGCPFEGRTPPERVLDIVRRSIEAGVAGVTLADTIGVANPAQVEDLVSAVLPRLDGVALTLHFHNTRGMGLANVFAAYRAGARRFDSSLGGIGGCPFAPGATGNISTEDTVHMFEEMGVETGVDLDALIGIARTLPPLLGHEAFGYVTKAGRFRTVAAQTSAA
jgi:hydroxymethylglutaryl-CoA lyase